jgi:hypothetical protein
VKTLAAVAVALAALVFAGSAHAHFVLRFDRQTARPGDTVSVGFADAHDVTVDVYLVPLEAARRFEPRPQQAPVELVPLGTLGPGGLSFTVPELPRGRYTTVLRRQDGRYLASTQPQFPVGVDPESVDEAPDPAVLRIVGTAPRGAAFLLVVLGGVFLAGLLAGVVIVHRRWQDAVSG